MSSGPTVRQHVRRYLRATVESLGNRNFRLFFAGQSVSISGTWMQKLAQAWLVLELTDSGTLLGVTMALQQLPTMLLTPWGGLLADRIDKRRILLVTQSIAAVPALLLGVLTATGDVLFWMVLVLAVVIGCVDAVDKPARHTFVIEMVGPRQVMNAVALNNITINAAKIVGPAVAGVLISSVGLSWCFFVNALSFAAVCAGLLLMRTDQLEPAARTARSRGQWRAGLRYVRGEPGLLGPLILMAVTGLFAYEWTTTLPLLARKTFGGDANVVGLMFAAMGAGAVLGALAAASTLKPTASRLILAGLVLAAALLVTALSGSLAVTVMLLFVLGTTSVAFRAIASSLVQLRAVAQMRGRVMALLVIAFNGTTPLGGPLAGWISDVASPPAALALGGIATAAAATATYFYLRRCGQFRVDAAAEPVNVGTG